MIGLIKGVLLEKHAPQMLIDVNGLGYEVTAPMTTFFELPVVGEPVQLYTHFVVREDSQALYGFVAAVDREVFRLLIKVNGIGPKVALAILSGMTVEELTAAVQADDSSALVRIPGIGLKTAQRLLVEVKDKLQQVLQGAVWVPATESSASGIGVMAEAESALLALGYKKAEATKALRKIKSENSLELSSEELIRLALRGMVTAS